MKNLITRLLYGVLLLSFSACQAAAESAPRLTVREATNCRAGPGTEYDIIVTYPVGTQLEVAGRDQSGNFWQVKSAESPTGLCWMWDEFVDVTGNPEAVPGVTLPPTAAGEPSEGLIVDQWEYSCESGTLSFTLNWRDRAEDESGYRVFRNGALLIELPAGSNAYTDTVALTDDPSVEYYLQAFGSDWTVNSAVMKADC